MVFVERASGVMFPNLFLHWRKYCDVISYPCFFLHKTLLNIKTGPKGRLSIAYLHGMEYLVFIEKFVQKYCKKSTGLLTRNRIHLVINIKKNIFSFSWKIRKTISEFLQNIIHFLVTVLFFFSCLRQEKLITSAVSFLPQKLWFYILVLFTKT